MYYWEDTLQDNIEVALILKAAQAQIPQLQQALPALLKGKESNAALALVITHISNICYTKCIDIKA